MSYDAIESCVCGHTRGTHAFGPPHACRYWSRDPENINDRCPCNYFCVPEAPADPRCPRCGNDPCLCDDPRRDERPSDVDDNIIETHPEPPEDDDIDF